MLGPQHPVCEPVFAKKCDVVPQIGERRVRNLLGREKIQTTTADIDPGDERTAASAAGSYRIGDDGFGNPGTGAPGRHHRQHLVFRHRLHVRSGAIVLWIA